MSQPVKLSDALVLDARIAGEVEKRSIAGQVEYWASLGKLIDALIDGRARTDALQRSGSKPLSELVATIGTPEGDARLRAYLESEPFPHFEPHPTRKGVLIRTDADGTRSAGRFVDREFVVELADDVIDAEYIEVSEKSEIWVSRQIRFDVSSSGEIEPSNDPIGHVIAASPISRPKHEYSVRHQKIDERVLSVGPNADVSERGTSKVSGGKGGSKKTARA
jgi:hypothetical protein